MDEQALRGKCEALAAAGDAMSAATLRALAELDRLRELTRALADRCAAQSELLSRRAEGVTSAAAAP